MGCVDVITEVMFLTKSVIEGAGIIVLATMIPEHFMFGHLNMFL
jgi:hypothetical protein